MIKKYLSIIACVFALSQNLNAQDLKIASAVPEVCTSSSRILKGIPNGFTFLGGGFLTGFVGSCVISKKNPHNVYDGALIAALIISPFCLALSVLTYPFSADIAEGFLCNSMFSVGYGLGSIGMAEFRMGRLFPRPAAHF